MTNSSKSTKATLDKVKDLPLNKDLEALLEKAKNHKMTPEEDDDQTIAMVVAECNHDDDIGATPETIRAVRVIEREHKGHIRTTARKSA